MPADADRTIVRTNAPGIFTAVHLAAGGRVVGVTAANNPREIRAGQAMIRAKFSADPKTLADADVPLQRLVGR